MLYFPFSSVWPAIVNQAAKYTIFLFSTFGTRLWVDPFTPEGLPNKAWPLEQYCHIWYSKACNSHLHGWFSRMSNQLKHQHWEPFCRLFLLVLLHCKNVWTFISDHIALLLQEMQKQHISAFLELSFVFSHFPRWLSLARWDRLLINFCFISTLQAKSCILYLPFILFQPTIINWGMIVMNSLVLTNQ